LPFKLMAPAVYSSPFNQQNNGDKPEICFIQSNRKPSEKNNCCPDEPEGSEASSCLLKNGKAKSKECEFLLRCR
jgi:hypothetical protein